MKNTIKEIIKDAVKRYLPMIINALCASICVTMAGCTVIGKADTVNTTPVKLSIAK